jgi:hypothetical protein
VIELELAVSISCECSRICFLPGSLKYQIVQKSDNTKTMRALERRGKNIIHLFFTELLLRALKWNHWYYIHIILYWNSRSTRDFMSDRNWTNYCVVSLSLSPPQWTILYSAQSDSPLSWLIPSNLIIISYCLWKWANEWGQRRKGKDKFNFKWMHWHEDNHDSVCVSLEEDRIKLFFWVSLFHIIVLALLS